MLASHKDKAAARHFFEIYFTNPLDLENDRPYYFEHKFINKGNDMGRRKKCRLVEGLPETTFFKPHGVPLNKLAGVTLPVEGLEALRLVDGEGLSQEQTAELMQVSRPTLCRILADARQIVARALSKGLAIRIEGGDYALPHTADLPPHNAPPRGPDDRERTGRGKGHGRGGGRRGRN